MTCTFTDHPRISVSNRVRFTYPCASRVQAAPMATTVTIEGHPLASRAGLWCPQGHFGRVEVDVAIVNACTLEVLRRVTASECVRCGESD